MRRQSTSNEHRQPAPLEREVANDLTRQQGIPPARPNLLETRRTQPARPLVAEMADDGRYSASPSEFQLHVAATPRRAVVVSGFALRLVTGHPTPSIRHTSHRAPKPWRKSPSGALGNTPAHPEPAWRIPSRSVAFLSNLPRSESGRD